jgi:hypothetical protein
MTFRWVQVRSIWHLTAIVDNEYVTFHGERLSPDQFGPFVHPPRDLPTVQTFAVLAPDREQETMNEDGRRIYYDDPIEIHSQNSKDCAVVCLANVLQIEYKKAKMLAFRHGWSSMSGMENGLVEQILKEEGYALKFRKDLVGSCSLKGEGLMIAITVGHIMPVVNGRLLNGNGLVIREVYEVLQAERDSEEHAERRI